jgi:hypothetical protein
MDFREYAVGRKAVIRKYDVLSEGLVENGLPDETSWGSRS